MDLKTILSETTFVFLDLETTGLYPQGGDRVCEIAAVKFQGTKALAKIETLVCPDRPIPPEVSALHHIYDNDVLSAPRFSEIASRVRDFLRGSVLCIYNVPFDLGFINAELARLKEPPLDVPTIDVLELARRSLTLSRYNLATVAEFFTVRPRGQFHRALADAMVTAEIFFRIVARPDAAQPGAREAIFKAAGLNVA